MIVKDNDSELRDYYKDSSEYDDVVKKLETNGQILVLGQNKYKLNKEITFYTFYENELKSLIDFNKFSYVKEFIDEVVQYRNLNNLDKVSNDDLLSVLSTFIKKYKDLIISNHQLRIEEKRFKIEQEALEAKMKLDEYNKKNNIQKRVVPNTNLIDRIGNMLNIRELKLKETMTPLELEFENYLTNIKYRYENETGNVNAFLGETIVSTPFTLILKVSLNGNVEYFHYEDGKSIANINDEGLIAIYDIKDRICDNTDINHFISEGDESYTTTIIDNSYIIELFVPSKFYSSDFIENLKRKEKNTIDYTNTVKQLVKSGLYFQSLCNLSDEDIATKNQSELRRLIKRM